LIFLLDVNVLIALVDPDHVHHDVVHDWFAANGAQGWATCPITENGAVRIISNPSYPNSPGSPALVGEALRALRGHAGHIFWPDDISLLSGRQVDLQRLGTCGQVTDSYLLALAAHRGGRLASLDRRLSTQAVAGGDEALHVLRS
jgi:hypothetical protein